VRARADEGQAGVADRLREGGVLGEEAVARMDGVGAGRGGWKAVRARPSTSSSFPFIFSLWASPVAPLCT